MKYYIVTEFKMIKTSNTRKKGFDTTLSERKYVIRSYLQYNSDDEKNSS